MTCGGAGSPQRCGPPSSRTSMLRFLVPTRHWQRQWQLYLLAGDCVARNALPMPVPVAPPCGLGTSAAQPHGSRLRALRAPASGWMNSGWMDSRSQDEWILGPPDAWISRSPVMRSGVQSPARHPELPICCVPPAVNSHTRPTVVHTSFATSYGALFTYYAVHRYPLDRIYRLSSLLFEEIFHIRFWHIIFIFYFYFYVFYISYLQINFPFECKLWLLLEVCLIL